MTLGMGATPLQRIIRVALPASIPSVLAGLVLIVALLFDGMMRLLTRKVV